MATIDVRPDNETNGLWWLVWIEENVVVAKVERDLKGSYMVVPEGPYWSPMKSFGRPYDGLDQATSAVQLYFKER